MLPSEPQFIQLLSDKLCRKCGNNPRKNKGLCVECNRAQVRAWQVANPERCKAQSRRSNHRRRSRHPEKTQWESAKLRAELEGIPFTITPDDITTPDVCPALGVVLRRNAHNRADSSPSLDRVIPGLGYVPGNIRVISYRANTIKNNGTFSELLRVANWLLSVEERGVTEAEAGYSDNFTTDRQRRVVGVREHRSETKQRYYSKHLNKVMWDSARARAIKANIPFTITPSDVVIPKVCPALGIILQRVRGKGGSDSSPSLDRIVPGLGYIPGNIVVLSAKANRIKYNANSLEIRLVAYWLEGVRNEL